MVSYYSLLYACVLNWSHPVLFLCMCFELVSFFCLLFVWVLNWSNTIIFFMPVSWIGLILFSSLCLCFESVSFFSLLNSCVLNWSHHALFFMLVFWIGLILFYSFCLCFELVSSWSLVYACVLNWSHPALFFMLLSWIGLILHTRILFFLPVSWVVLILLFIRNRKVCLRHSFLLLTLLTFYNSNHNSTRRIIQLRSPSLFSIFKDSLIKFSMDHQRIRALRMVNQFLWANLRKVPSKKEMNDFEWNVLFT